MSFITAFDTIIRFERGSTQHGVSCYYPAAPVFRGEKGGWEE